MTNPNNPSTSFPASAHDFQAAPTRLESDEVCFSPDPGSLIALLSLNTMQIYNITEAPHISLFADPSKKGGYNIRAVTTFESDRDTELQDTYNKHVYYNLPAYAVDQVMRYAETESLSLQIYKTQSRDVLKQAQALKDTPLPSLPQEGMTDEQISALPLPYIIFVGKHYVLGELDEFGDLISKNANQEEIDQIEYETELNTVSPKDAARLLKEREKKMREEEELEEKVGEEIERIKEEYGVILDYAEEEFLEPGYDYNIDLITRSMSARHAQEFTQGLEEKVRVPSEILFVLEYIDGVPTYAAVEAEPSGVKTFARVYPENGELVSLVCKFGTNLREDILEQRIRDDGAHHLARDLNNFDIDVIEPMAAIFDRKHAIMFGWDG